MQASSFSSDASAASTAATDAGRPAANGTIVSGNSVVFCNGRTGISNGVAPNFCAGSTCDLCWFFGSSVIGRNEFCPSLAGGTALQFFAALFVFTKTQKQQSVAVVTFDLRVLDIAGKLNDFLEAAVGDFQLVMRDPFTAEAVAHDQLRDHCMITQVTSTW